MFGDCGQVSLPGRDLPRSRSHFGGSRSAKRRRCAWRERKSGCLSWPCTEEAQNKSCSLGKGMTIGATAARLWWQSGLREGRSPHGGGSRCGHSHGANISAAPSAIPHQWVGGATFSIKAPHNECRTEVSVTTTPLPRPTDNTKRMSRAVFQNNLRILNYLNFM